MATVSDDQLRGLMMSMLANDNMCRKRAEAEWGTVVHLPGVPGALVRCVRESGSVPLSQMALVLLKNHVTAFNRTDLVEVVAGGGGGGSPILHLLADCEDERLTKLVGGLVARIAALREGPWDELREVLGRMLLVTEGAPMSECHATVALQTLSELAATLSGEMVGFYTPLAGAILSAALNRASTTTSALASPAAARRVDNVMNSTVSGPVGALGPNCQRMALRVLAEMCLVVGAGGDARQGLLELCSASIQEVALIGCLPTHLQDPIANGIPHEAMKLASVIANFAPEGLDAGILGNLLAALASDCASYTSVLQEFNDAQLEASVAQVASSRFDLLQKFFAVSRRVDTQVPNGAAQHTLNNEASCKCLFDLVVSYSAVSIHTADTWVDNVDYYLKSESDREDQVSAETRDVAVEALSDAVKVFGAPFADALWTLCQQSIMSSQQWRHSEAALFVASQLLSRRVKIFKQSHSFLSGITPMCEHVASAMMGGGGDSHSCVVLRCLAFLAVVVQKCRSVVDVKPMVRALFPPSCATLSGTSNASVVAASCRLLQRMLPVAERGTVGDETTVSVLGSVLRSCFLRDIPKELLYSLLELCLVWIRGMRKHGVSPACVSDLPKTLVEVWRAHLEDPNVSELIVDSLIVLVGEYPNTHRSFLAASPWIASALRGQESMAALCALPSLLTIIRRLIRIGSEELLAEVGNTLLGPLCQLLLVNDDTGILGPASLTLGAMLVRLNEVVFNCSVDIPASHLQQHGAGDDGVDNADAIPPLDEAQISVPFPVVVESVAARILNPHRSELGLMNTGGFLTSLVPVVSILQANYANYMAALSQRCLTVRMDTSLQELLLPVCRSLIDDTQRSLGALHASGTLIALFERWLPLIPQLYGRVLMMRTAQALSAVIGLLCSDDSAAGDAAGWAFTWRLGDYNSNKYKKGSSTITGLTFGTATFLALTKLLERALRQSKTDDFKSSGGSHYRGYEEDVFAALHEDAFIMGHSDSDGDADSYDSADDDEEVTDEEEADADDDPVSPPAADPATSGGLRREYAGCFKAVAAVMHTHIAQQVGASGYLTPKEIQRLQKHLQ